MKTTALKFAIGFVLRIVLLSIGFFNTSYAQESDDVLSPINSLLKLAYIGNMGVLVEHNEKTVLFDGFHKKYKPDYQFPKKKTITKLTKGTYGDFSSIEITLFSHAHGDHFNAAYAQLFLDENPNGIVVGPTQITEEILELKMNKSVQSVNAINAIPYDGKLHPLEHEGIQVNGIQCNHVNPSRHSSVQNIAYLVTLDGYKVLHIGDTNWNLVDPPFKNLQLKSQEIDIAILPYWMLLSKEAKELLVRLIDPTKVIATHIPPNFSGSDERALLNTYPNVVLFTELNQQFHHEKSKN